jgi:hypothetical protein
VALLSLIAISNGAVKANTEQNNSSVENIRLLVVHPKDQTALLTV